MAMWCKKPSQNTISMTEIKQVGRQVSTYNQTVMVMQNKIRVLKSHKLTEMDGMMGRK